MAGLPIRYPFPDPKSKLLVETRTFYHTIDKFNQGEHTPSSSFMKWAGMEFDVGYSLCLPTKWSLIIVSCGSGEDEDYQFIGLFLDHIMDMDDANRNAINSEDMRHEFLVRCDLEVSKNGGRIKRMVESDPQSHIHVGNWIWRKVPLFINPSKLMDTDPVKVRITFTLCGRRKDPLASSVPSSHVNHLNKMRGRDEEIAMNLYNLIRRNDNKAVVTLELEGGKEFNVFRTMLCGRSPVFDRMFDHPEMTEASSNRVLIQGISPDTMPLFLKHLHTGQTEVEWFSNPKVAVELLDIAQRYWFHDLLDFCDTHLLHAANEENCMELLDLANLHGLDKAKKELSEFLRENETKCTRDHQNE